MKVTALKQVSYDPSIFLNVETVDEAVRIILTPEDGLTSQQRWKNETPYLIQLIEKHVGDIEGDFILDYGCGIGRMAKPLMRLHSCEVVGVDISPNMRALAASCVEYDRFFAIAPVMLTCLGDKFDGALAIWTLQHCLELGEVIETIRDHLNQNGWLFVVNNHKRAIPSNAGPWLDDGRNVDAEILASGFDCIERGQLEGADIASEWLAKQTFWAVYRKI